MKAGIITHYDVHNHGASLQLYALVQQLKMLGYDAKALRFQKNYDFMGGVKAAAKYNISARSIPTYLKYLYKNGYSRTLYNYKKRRLLSDFRKEQGLVGEFYSEAKDLDLVVIGSDEILSVEAGPNPWYYGIGVPCENQISYAASFGPTTLEMIDAHNVSALVEAGLKNISSISTRDANSANIVRHYTGIEASLVCDPVLLFDFKEYYSEESKEQFRKKHPEKYCIVYSYDFNMNDKTTVDSIKEYTKKTGVKIYSVGYFHKWCDKNINLKPLEVFNWFACAELVFTDTFHGTVISLVTETQFITKIRRNGNKLSFLLEQYGVADRKTNTFEDIQLIAERKINYETVNNTKNYIRKNSLQYLSMAVCNNNDKH